MTTARRRSFISSLLVLAAIGLLWPIYNAPIWWVSLEAPNYPPEDFPDGVRIEFHLNGVLSGCGQAAGSADQEGDALDCVHEMDTINHYVGMYPIASGGAVEVFFSLFLVAMVGVMLLGFLVRCAVLRMSIMSAGFVAVAVWMGLAFLGPDGLRYQSARYLAGRVMDSGESLADETPDRELSSGEALVARLKASLAESKAAEGGEAQAAPAAVDGGAKEQSLRYFRDAFNQDTDRIGDEQWQGSGSQFIPWHYRRNLGRYFRDPEVLEPMVAGIAKEGTILFWGIIVAMIVLVGITRRPGGAAEKLLTLAPAGLPLFFVIEYSVWLWWYGHHMNEMGAFTLKPFMPTVFGQGKVAQFTTNSYPEYGFGLMILFSLLLLAAMLLRRERIKDDEDN